MSTSTIDTVNTAASRVACLHCGQTAPDRADFCCAGCRAVYEAINSCGLGSYYKLKEAASAPASPGGKYEAFDSETFSKLYVLAMSDGRHSVDLILEGVNCGACVWLIERLPRVLPGVIEARLSLRDQTVRVDFDPAVVSLSKIAQALDRFGYKSHAARGVSKRELHRKQHRAMLADIGWAGALMGNIMLLAVALYAGWFGHMEHEYHLLLRWVMVLLGVASLAIPGRCFFVSSWNAIRARTVNLDLTITLALVVGGVAGVINVVFDLGELYFDSLSMLVFLLLCGRYLQWRQQRSAEDAVELLFSMTPRTARRVGCAEEHETDLREIPVESLQVGDVVEVWAGELFCADGVIVTGRSSMDQSLLSGESEPLAVESGDRVFAGAMNIGATLRVRVCGTGRDTRVGRLMDLVERGVREKPAMVLFSDRVSNVFLPAVCVLGAACFAVWLPTSPRAAIDHTVAFLIVTCPCVLGLATPLTLAVATGHLARRNILVKTAVALEKLSRNGRVLMDKTGTLTEGRLRVLAWHGDTSWRPIVAEVERRSRHAAGRAIVEAFGDDELSASDRSAISDITEKNDGGISATYRGLPLRIGSLRYMTQQHLDLRAADLTGVDAPEAAGVVYVAIGERVVASVLLGDRVRSDTADAIRLLANRGWDVQMLSGDSRRVAERVAGQVGIVVVHAEMLPEEKLRIVSDISGGQSAGDSARATNRELTRRGVSVMVGDGVNDAAALAAADVGIAVHGGAEASLAAADVYVARPGLAGVVELFSMARRTMFIVRRNFAISLTYNVLAGGLALAGLMNPMIAAIIMPISSLSVLSNAVWSVKRSARRSAMA